MEFSFEQIKKLLEKAPPLEVPFVERIDTENKVLECRVCEDRTMLVALTDLIDPYEVERMEEMERLKDLGELDRVVGFCTYGDNDCKEVRLTDCLMCKFCLPPDERINGIMCSFNKKGNSYERNQVQR